jgi:HlyD family secretion protein
MKMRSDELDYWSKRREITLASQAQDERIRVAQMQQLRASVSQLEQNLTLARSNLENLLVVAPRSGLLSSFDAEIGESKARGERLGQIDDVDQFKASALVNEFYLNRVSVGQQARLELDGKATCLSSVRFIRRLPVRSLKSICASSVTLQ